MSLWVEVCRLDDILPDTGAAALVAGRQIALFRLGEGSVYAIGNRDPFSRANVLARGIVGDLRGEPVVASPVYKQHFSLVTGKCLEEPAVCVPVYPARLQSGAIWVEVPHAEARASARRPRLVVVGNGIAATSLLEALAELAPGRYDIAVFGAEPHGGYNRVLLSQLVAGAVQREELLTHPPEWYARRGIALHLGDPVARIERARRVVVTRSGREAAYDRLVLATGSRPAVPPLPGREKAGVISFRDLEDAEAIVSASRGGANAVVVGGGLLGVETAHGLARRGVRVTVVHLAQRLIERTLDAAASAALARELEARGVRVLLGARAEAVLGAERAQAVRLADGRVLPAELVVIAAGVVPDVELAREAGLPCERGVLVSDTMQSFDPRIYAVGECVQHRGATYGLAAPVREQARVCANQLAGRGELAYRGSIAAVRLKLDGLEVFAAGECAGGSGARELVYSDAGRGVYKRIVLRDGRLAGVVLYGDAADGEWYLELMRRGAEVGRYGERLLFGRRFAETRAA